MQLASVNTYLKMKRGLANLPSIVITAPLIGLFGTTIGILDAFKGCGTQKWACLAATIEGICEALATALLGLLAAVLAAWFYNYLSDRLEIFNTEMQLASSELLNYLSIRYETLSPPRS